MSNIYEVLSQQEIAEYVKDGFSIQQLQGMVNDIVKDDNTADLNSAGTVKSNTQSSSANSLFSGAYSADLIRYQLEMDGLLERIEHMLRGDKIEFKDGSHIWVKQTENDKIIFNSQGVSEIMRALSMYLNINTILSNYDEKTINNKVYDIGNEINNLIYLKYKDFGLKTLGKRKLYPIIVMEMVDVIHSSYLRALNGGERDSLREARHVTQTDNQSSGAGGVNINVPGGPNKRGILNPLRYISGPNK